MIMNVMTINYYYLKSKTDINTRYEVRKVTNAIFFFEIVITVIDR